MSKGYFLGKWLTIGEKIHRQMDALFIKNNVPLLSLNQLPDADRAEWDLLKKKSERVSDKMCKLILSK